MFLIYPLSALEFQKSEQPLPPVSIQSGPAKQLCILTKFISVGSFFHFDIEIPINLNRLRQAQSLEGPFHKGSKDKLY
jgi:hypothetical protein